MTINNLLKFNVQNDAELVGKLTKLESDVKAVGGNANVLTTLGDKMSANSKNKDIFAEYIKKCTPYVRKNAVVARPVIRIFVHSLVVLTKRSNIKAFKTEEEAVAWLGQ